VGEVCLVIGLPVAAAWRTGVDHPQLLTIEHGAGRALLRDGFPAAARVDTGHALAALPLPL